MPLHALCSILTCFAFGGGATGIVRSAAWSACTTSVCVSVITSVQQSCKRVSWALLEPCHQLAKELNCAVARPLVFTESLVHHVLEQQGCRLLGRGMVVCLLPLELKEQTCCSGVSGGNPVSGIAT